MTATNYHMAKAKHYVHTAFIFYLAVTNLRSCVMRYIIVKYCTGTRFCSSVVDGVYVPNVCSHQAVAVTFGLGQTCSLPIVLLIWERLIGGIYRAVPTHART